MTVLSYIIDGEAVDNTVSNRVVRQILSLSGLNPDLDFPGFLSTLAIQQGGVNLGGVNTINFTGQAVATILGNTANVDVENKVQVSGVDQGPVSTFNFLSSLVVTISGGIATIDVPPPSLSTVLNVGNSGDGTKQIRNILDPTLAQDVVTLNYANAHYLPILTTLPATTTPIAQYYTADLGIGVADGQPVPTWADQSGNALDLLANDTGATSPTFHSNIDGDGLPCVSFDGSANQLSRRAMAANSSTQLTFFVVSRSAHITTNSTLCSICGSGGDNSGDGAITVTTKEPTGLQMRFNFNSTSGVFAASATTSNSNASTDDGIAEWTIAVYRLRTIFGGGYITIRQNFSGASFALGVALTTNTYTHVYLGSGSTSGVGWPTNSKCDVRAFGIYKGLLQDYEVRQLLRYLGTKWNITGFI